jgi:uncharacterized protein YjcR
VDFPQSGRHRYSLIKLTGGCNAKRAICRVISARSGEASDCYDNAVAESFFSSLKQERIRNHMYYTRAKDRADIFDYIEVFYNRARRHSRLDGM